MDAARDFARGVKTRDHGARPVEALRLRVAVEAAHRVVNGHAGVASPEGTLFDFLREVAFRLAEVLVLLRVDEAVVALHARFETVGVHPHLLGEFAKRRSGPRFVDGNAFLDALMNGGVVLLVRLIVNNGVGVMFGCTEDGVANDVAARAFVDDAIATFVDVNGFGHARIENDLHLLAGGSARGGLDEVHADQVAAHAHGRHHHVARRLVRKVVGAETGDARIV